MVSTSIVTLVFLVCLQTVLLSTVSNCAKTISMYWNTTNSIFRIDNTDHIIDVNKNNAAFEYDQVNIICPVYQPGTYDDEAEKYIIYNVSKEEYETCRITNPSPRVIAICDKPFKTMYFTITFRPFTPQPGGLEFHPGRDYYFISTSSKDDLHRRIGGRCTTHNMKVVFKVCCNNDDNSSSFSGGSRNNSIAVTSSTVSTSTSTTNSNVISMGGGNGNGNGNNNNNNVNGNSNGIGVNGINPSGNGVLVPVMPPSVYKERYYPNVHQQPPMGGHPSPVDRQQPDQLPGPILPHVPQLPMYPNYPHQQQPQPPMYPGLIPNSQTPKTSITQKKKNKEYSDHPNEVVKNEELTYNGAPSLQRTTRNAVCALALLCSVLLPNLMR